MDNRRHYFFFLKHQWILNCNKQQVFLNFNQLKKGFFFSNVVALILQTSEGISLPHSSEKKERKWHGDFKECRCVQLGADPRDRSLIDWKWDSWCGEKRKRATREGLSHCERQFYSLVVVWEILRVIWV